ncbi:MAG: hypothetical protein FRX49_05033 [Trebouxia sp. A1-2]|nr:MAG: hypothetical protein FRX49_05033 [Trebouxia sp. A1-2]
MNANNLDLLSGVAAPLVQHLSGVQLPGSLHLIKAAAAASKSVGTDNADEVVTGADHGVPLGNAVKQYF